MTKLHISLPDSSPAVVNAIKELVAEVGGYISVDETNAEELRSDLQESLHQAIDIMEGKSRRQSLRDALNG
jgi:hypothetical protein